MQYSGSARQVREAVGSQVNFYDEQSGLWYEMTLKQVETSINDDEVGWFALRVDLERVNENRTRYVSKSASLSVSELWRVDTEGQAGSMNIEWEKGRGQFYFLGVLMIVAGLVTLPGAIYLRKFKPNICKTATKEAYRLNWKIFALGAVMFGVISVINFIIKEYFNGVFFLCFCVLQIIGLIQYRYRRPLGEIEKAIDESDPTKLWPWWFWKVKNKG